MAQIKEVEGFLGGEYVRQMDNKARTFRDFYQAPDSEGVSEDSGSESDSQDSEAKSTGSWKHPALKKKSELTNKKQQYYTQLKRNMPARENKFDKAPKAH